MSPSFWKMRSKSTSDILEASEAKTSFGKDVHGVGPIGCENRFRTYSHRDLRLTRTYLMGDLARDYDQNYASSKKSPSASKSQSFVKKLVASLEKKDQSGDCSADDEFLATCYARPDAGGVARNAPMSGWNFRNTHNDSGNDDIFHGRSLTASASTLFEEGIPEESENEQESDRGNDKNGSAEDRPTGPTYNGLPIVDQRNGRDYVPRDGLCRDRAWSTFEEERSTSIPVCTRTSREKKPARKRSFKNFLGSMIGWKGSKARPRRGRFGSSEGLDERSKFGDTTDPVFAPKVAPTYISAYEYHGEHLPQVPARNATIRPIYGAKVCEKLSDKVFEKLSEKLSVELSGELRDSSTEAVVRAPAPAKQSALARVDHDSPPNLVKPSTVKDMARRLSLLPDQPWINADGQAARVPMRVKTNCEKRLSRRKGVVEAVYDFPRPNAPTALANGRSVPIDLRIGKEYSAILANGFYMDDRR